MKKNKILLVVLLLGLVLFAGCGNKTEEKKSDDKYANKVNVVMEIKDYGSISLELYPDIAPETVNNFVSLAKAGFYDNLTFHRIIDGFMIQGGDPQANGFGGSDKTIKGEFSANGFNNPLKHERGVISMARGPYDYNSASSQFFIVQTTAPSLDGQYASFGRVTKGIEIVDQICKDTPVEDDDGTVLRENQPVIVKVTVME